MATRMTLLLQPGRESFPAEWALELAGESSCKQQGWVTPPLSPHWPAGGTVLGGSGQLSPFRKEISHRHTHTQHTRTSNKHAHTHRE